MGVHGIQHFNIRASEEEILALRDFYSTVIGLTLGPRPAFRSRGFWLYAGGDPVLHLSIASQSQSLPDLEARRSAADHIAFRCSDLKGMLARLDAHGIRYSLERVPLVNQIQVFLSDPSGVGVELNFDSASEASAATPPR